MIGKQTMQEQMKNVAYTKEYEKSIEKAHHYLFRKKNFQSEESIVFSRNLSVQTSKYFFDSDIPDYPYNLAGNENTLIFNGKEIYTYRTINTSGFQMLFRHQNGKEYFLFTQDLYGYSILDINTLEDYRFYPRESFPTGETFIWCDAKYNLYNNILIVHGCYWACPYNILLLDLTNPLQENRQIDGYNHLAGDIDSAEWRDTDLIVTRKTSTRPHKKTIQVIPDREYMSWFC